MKTMSKTMYIMCKMQAVTGKASDDSISKRESQKVADVRDKKHPTTTQQSANLRNLSGKVTASKHPSSPNTL